MNTTHVAEIRRAMEAGAEVPPVVICKKTKRIVDGFHRTRAAIAIDGDDAKVDVVEKTYKSDGALFLDAMRYNASHGLRMNTHDTVRCHGIAERLKLTVEQVAGVLHVPVDKYAALVVDRTATSGSTKLTVPIKRTIRHMAGRRLSRKQEQANDSISGMQQVFYVNQIITLIEADLLDTADAKLMDRLGVLAGHLDRVVTATA